MPETNYILRLVLAGLLLFMAGYIFQSWLRKRHPRALPAPKDVKAPPSDAQHHRMGLYTKTIFAVDSGEHPGPESVVTVHYSGWTTDGKMFDSTWTRGQPATFKLSHLIPGWQQGIQLMRAGEYRRLWIPEELAYQGQKHKPKGMLVFDVQLIKIHDDEQEQPETGDV